MQSKAANPQLHARVPGPMPRLNPHSAERLWRLHITYLTSWSDSLDMIATPRDLLPWLKATVLHVVSLPPPGVGIHTYRPPRYRKPQFSWFCFNTTHTQGGQSSAYELRVGVVRSQLPDRLRSDFLFIWTNVKNFNSAMQVRVFHWL